MAKEETKEKVSTTEVTTKTTSEKDEPISGAAFEQTNDTPADSQLEITLSNEYKLPGTQDQHPLSHKSLKKIIIIALTVIGLAIIGGAILWSTHDEPVSKGEASVVYTQGAAVTAVEGDVEYNTGTGWDTVDSGTNLQEGYSLRTLKASRAIITLDEGSAIRLDGDSEISLAKLTAEEVIIDNEGGQIYTRVVPSETRLFVVTIGDQQYQALGTAYKTVNEEEEKGVEVYHSKVNVKDKSEVAEGEAYFTKSKDEEREAKIAALDPEKLSEDDFLNWNKTKDQDDEKFADKLGFLNELGKKKVEAKEEPEAQTTPGVSTGITLSGSKGEKGIDLNWTVVGVDVSEGFKVAYDKTDTTPSYGENSAKFISAGSLSTVLDLSDGNTWNIRICAYRGDGVCENYSNAIKITAPKIDKPVVKAGTINLQTIENVLAWSADNSAPYGYKVVRNQTGNPTYPGDNPVLVKGGQYRIPTDLDPGTYHFRVCKYNGNVTDENPEKCLYYSDDVKYVKN